MHFVRVWFEKTGRAKYISHLDLMRCMTRAIKRAKIPVWYTEGYNPRPYITFPRPLSLGLESLCECVDVRLDGEMRNNEILENLSRVMPDGIKIKAVTQPFMEQTEIEFSEYEIIFDSIEDSPNFAESITKSLSNNELIVEKLGKSGRRKVLKQVNLIEHIKEYDVTIDGNNVELKVILPASNTVSINPTLLTEALLKAKNLTGVYTNITRTRLLDGKFNNFE